MEQHYSVNWVHRVDWVDTQNNYSDGYMLAMAEKGRSLDEVSFPKNWSSAILATHFEYSDQQFSLAQ